MALDAAGNVDDAATRDLRDGSGEGAVGAHAAGPTRREGARLAGARRASDGAEVARRGRACPYSARPNAPCSGSSGPAPRSPAAFARRAALEARGYGTGAHFGPGRAARPVDGRSINAREEMDGTGTRRRSPGRIQLVGRIARGGKPLEHITRRATVTTSMPGATNCARVNTDALHPDLYAHNLPEPPPRAFSSSPGTCARAA